MPCLEEELLKSKKVQLKRDAKKATAYIVLYGRQLANVENKIADIDCRLSNLRLQIKKALR